MFKGLGNLGNIASMVGALQDLPERMKELNSKMQEETVSAGSPCGTVIVVMSGTGNVHSVTIVEGTVSGSELEVAVLSATNAAGAAAKQLYADSIAAMVEEMDLNLPGLENILTSLKGG